ncbi:MAG TPA: hypothetical protein VK925_05095 [Jiangellaceae bacterium]|nr:hypothetical protein [Jiangellaceae bacterium]
MAISMPTATTRWRCAQCGNLTRFDVVRSVRVREYVHFTLAGEPRVEESETLGEVVEQVRCRWCGSERDVEVVRRVDADESARVAAEDVEPA